ncbi:hypothetical protein A0256_20875 [Mucilaginibacter sp. PAMC 26640]|nr:hypothetical protein A0256_20875 [Mucilaginibacter sp. PAMC 26640]
MNNMHLNAYTIIEITITMILSAIVISITYTAFGIVSTSYHRYRDEQEGIAEVVQLDRLLKRDFTLSERVSSAADGEVTFTVKNLKVSYNFQPDYIIRTSGITDTFKVASGNLSLNFEDQALRPQGDTIMLDELSFDLVYKNRSIPYIYHKRYSADELITNQADAIH